MNLDLTADELISAVLGMAADEPVCVLDSSGVPHLGSHLLIAGVGPARTIDLASADVSETLEAFDSLLGSGLAVIFTISYEFGRKIQGFESAHPANEEPDIFASLFDVLIVHDYRNGSTSLVGDEGKFASAAAKLNAAAAYPVTTSSRGSVVRSNVRRDEYLHTVDGVKERIRCGDTYQANITQQLSADLHDDLTAEKIFLDLRKAHPAPFSAFIRRYDSTVISASPERFFRIEDSIITTSPIKGTRPRGKLTHEDEALRRELLTSTKDRAENTMIVDLLRNDLGRVCEYGSVRVEKLCELQEHPSLFHLVSTVSGRLRANTRPSDVLRALFPCGSITGAPKISTMRIIDEIEPSPRGLSMGAIGYYIPPTNFDMPEIIDTSVAIRTMVVRGQKATFNVGGGIVIDSEPGKEYDETLTKASALMNAINGRLET